MSNGGIGTSKALLTREGEVHWARAREEATADALEAVLDSPIAAASLRALKEELERHALRPGRLFNLNALRSGSDAADLAEAKRRLRSRARGSSRDPAPPLSGPVVERLVAVLHAYADPMRALLDRAPPREERAVVDQLEQGTLSPFVACTTLGRSLPELRELQVASSRARELEARVGKETGRDVRAILELDDRAQRAIAARKRAQRVLVEANTRLVLAQAHKLVGRGLDLDDLVQEGSVGLLVAVEKFDHRRGFKFSTYALWWIRQAMTRALANRPRLIRLPIHVSTTLGRAARARTALKVRLGRLPTTEEIADEIGVVSRKLQTMLDAAREPISFDAPLMPDSDTVPDAVLPDPDAPDPVRDAVQQALQEQLDRLLQRLPIREQVILRQRFGLTTDARTPEELGRHFQLSRERLRQVERAALCRLRRLPGTRRLRALLD